MTGIRANYGDWRHLSEMYAWEVAMLIHGYDPRARGDVITPEGDPIEISHEVRAISAAVRNGVLQGTHDTDRGDELTVVLTASLLPWLRSHGHFELEQALTVSPAAISSPSASNSALHSRARPRQRTQEDLIVDTIRTLGYEPHRLPARSDNKPWVKSQVREVLRGTPDFVSQRVFDKAWERLRSQGVIREQS